MGLRAIAAGLTGAHGTTPIATAQTPVITAERAHVTVNVADTTAEAVRPARRFDGHDLNPRYSKRSPYKRWRCTGKSRGIAFKKMKRGKS